MTVSSTDNIAVLQGNGVTTVFPFDFVVLEEDDLIIESRVAATGVTFHTYLAGEYTVTGLGDATGGSITILGTPLAAGYELVITRQLDYDQPLDLVNQGGFYPASVEQQFDRTTMQIQQIADEVTRTLRFPPGEPGASLPPSIARAGLFLGFDASGNPIASPGTGADAGLREELADEALGASLVAGLILPVLNRAALKLILPTAYATAYLREAGRQGLFEWVVGNFSTYVAADTQEGVYVASSLISATAGVWRRVSPMPGYWHVDWFGVPEDPAAGNGGGTEVQCHTEMTAMVNLANIVKPNVIVFGSKIYTLGVAIPEWNFQVILQGARGAQGTILVKRYVEASAVRGILAFNDHGATVDKMTLRASSGSGGSGISAILTLNEPALGRLHLIDTYISLTTNAGVWANYSLYINGASNTNAAGPGYRGVFIRGGEFFGAAVAAFSSVAVQHLLAAGVFISNSGGPGTANVAIQTAGNATTYNDDWQVHGVIGGVVNLNWFGGGNPGGVLGGRSQFISPQTDSINVDVNCLSTTWTGPRHAGIVTNLSGTGFTTSWDGMVVARGGSSSSGWQKWGDGKIRQWGAVTTNGSGVAADNALPVSFTSTNIQYASHATGDPGANIAKLSYVYNGTVPDSQYSVKAYLHNFSSGAVTASASVVRWTADGQ